MLLVLGHIYDVQVIPDSSGKSGCRSLSLTIEEDWITGYTDSKEPWNTSHLSTALVVPEPLQPTQAGA